MNADDDFAKKRAEIQFQSLSYIFNSIMKDCVYKTRDMEPFYEQVKELVPAASGFFVPWLRGFVCVAQFDFDAARDFYCSALANVKFASDYLVQFLQQGLALSLYCGDRETAVQFWNAGAENGVFAHQDGRFFDSVNAKEQFWVQFSPALFVDSERAEKRVVADYRNIPEDDVQRAIDSGDYDAFVAAAGAADLNSYRINGVSVLYYTVQRRGLIAGGAAAFTETVVAARTERMLAELGVSSLPKELRVQQSMAVLHQMRVTFEKSGLARLMFIAECGDERFLDGKRTQLERIISECIERTDDVDSFVRHAAGKMGTNALHLAAELDDSVVVAALLRHGSDGRKILGYAPFGMRYSDGRSVSTEIPNSLIYRLIHFLSWKSLEMYLSEFSEIARPSLTEKSCKCNITPLVYLILKTIYSSADEGEYKQNKELVDRLIPLFVGAGAVLDENTAFGTAESLLGMRK